jgi:adenosylcobinamide kinase/adenosylcobinamide-phosphate guanylyltransferase
LWNILSKGMISTMNQAAPQLIFILGGARSGKSSYAQSLAIQHGRKRVLYVATAEPGDDEMVARIAVHKAARPPEWMTLEAPQHVGQAVNETVRRIEPELVLLDCLTLLASNLLVSLPELELDKQGPQVVQEEINGLIETYKQFSIPWIIVSNEVGLGLVPPNPLGRAYRDALGWANQLIAACADQVIFMAAGIPMVIKGH